MSQRETLIEGATLVAMDEAGSVGASDVLIRGAHIAWIGARGRAPRAKPGARRQRVSAAGCALMPGLIQSHVHLCQVLFRGLADDLPLLRWLKERIWPFEAAHSEQSLSVSARLGVAELLRGGTTTLLDMGTVHHQDAIFEVLDKTGIRALSGKAMMDRGRGVPKGLRETTRASLRESERLHDRWQGKAAGRLHYAYAPRFILSCSEGLLRDVAALARSQGALVHTHAAEHPAERRAVIDALGVSDVRALDRWGILGPSTVIAHGVQLTAAEMRMLGRRGTRVVHCPSTNLKLASGVADVVAMGEAGIVRGIGADGAPCNNRLDALGEIRTASLLAKMRRGDAAALAPMEALRLATSEGARCLGLQDEIGSVEVGKRADLIAVRLDGLHQAPMRDPLSALVYASSAEDVFHVWVDGVQRVRSRELLDTDVPALLAEATRQVSGVLKRIG